MKVCVRQDTTYNNFKIGPFQFQIEHLKKNNNKMSSKCNTYSISTWNQQE